MGRFMNNRARALYDVHLVAYRLPVDGDRSHINFANRMFDFCTLCQTRVLCECHHRGIRIQDETICVVRWEKETLDEFRNASREDRVGMLFDYFIKYGDDPVHNRDPGIITRP